jgi:hypothetical protein
MRADFSLSLSGLGWCRVRDDLCSGLPVEAEESVPCSDFVLWAVQAEVLTLLRLNRINQRRAH